MNRRHPPAWDWVVIAVLPLLGSARLRLDCRISGRSSFVFRVHQSDLPRRRGAGTPGRGEPRCRQSGTLAGAVRSFTVILIGTLLVSGCQFPANNERQGPQPSLALSSPSRVWAVQIAKPGLPNLHRVSDDLYRGAQPTAEGFRQLKAMGVKTVVNLRFWHNDRKKISGTNLAYDEIPMNAWHAEDEDVVRFLSFVADRTRAPFFIHCHHGADRTGLMCAVYRIVIQGWTKDEAIAEMTQGGFGFHAIYGNLVNYLRKLDVEKLKRQTSHSRPQNKHPPRTPEISPES